MDKKPSHDPIFRDDTYVNICSKKAIDFVNNIISEEEYIKFHEDSNGRNTLPWPELFLLRKDMCLYRKFLLKFSLQSRRLVLANEEVIGFSQQALYDNYGISFSPLARYIGKGKTIPRKKLKPKIRNIITSDSNLFHKEFIAFMALLARVPIDWLEEEIPENKWSVHHLNSLEKSRMDTNKFIEIIHSCSKELHDVRGIILEVEKELEIYIRLELIKGSFILEILNKENLIKSIDFVLGILKDYNIKIGYMATVIPSQSNFTIICNYCSQESINLPGFKLLQL